MMRASSRQKPMAIVKDADIRSVLFPMLRSQANNAALVVEELGLCEGEVFADLAVIEKQLEGFEIKSDTDSLRRFERQRDVYSRVMTRASIVVTDKHLDEARSRLPQWWGILIALPNGRTVEIASVRKARRNPAVDPSALVQLLWRDEALQQLEQMGEARGLRSKPRKDLWARLSAELSLRQLQAVVCERIKKRAGWKSASTQTQCDDSCLLEPTFRDFRHRPASADTQRCSRHPN
jgi:hypothetical protein